MNMFAAFGRAIDDGLFDEVEGADKNGAQRLTAASDPFVREGAISKEQQEKLLQRLAERKLQMLRGAST
jgi:hypothetical protein